MALGPRGRCSQQDPEEAKAHLEQERPWKGPGSLPRGRCPVAERSGTAVPGDLAVHPGARRPFRLHVGVGTPGSTAPAERNSQARSCRKEETALRKRGGAWGGVLSRGRGRPEPNLGSENCWSWNIYRYLLLILSQARPCTVGAQLPRVTFKVTAKTGFRTAGPGRGSSLKPHVAWKPG